MVLPNRSVEMSVNLRACDKYSNLDSTRGRPHWIDLKKMFQNGWSSLLLLKICVTLCGESCLKNTEYPKLEDPTSCRGDVHDPATEQLTCKYFTLLTLEHPQSLSLPSSIVCDNAAEPPVNTHHHHDAESRNDEEAGSGSQNTKATPVLWEGIVDDPSN